MKDISKYILNIREKIKYWNYLYYIENTSEVSDSLYDNLIRELFLLEKKHPEFLTKDSPTQYIGSKNKQKNYQISHKIPMLSLDNIFNHLDFISFDKKTKTKLNSVFINYCCELKIDGIALSLLYENGILTKASTRGDGVLGEDVTNNVCSIKTIPRFLNKTLYPFPSILEIRGEVFILKNDFMLLNKKMNEQEKKCFSNPRNAASGFLRYLDPLNIYKKYLKFYCYSNGFFSDEINIFPDSHISRLQQFRSWGIPITPYTTICKKSKHVLDFYFNIYNKREEIDFDIDGIVVKVNSSNQQKFLGCVSRFPRWAVAYKFPGKKCITLIKDVKFNVSRTGIITPVAILNPIFISGVKISSATLHNFNEINRLGLMIGDYIIVQRAGDVIPKVISIVISKRTKNVKPINFPKQCPCCESLLNNLNNKYTLYCPNSLTCSAQLVESIKHFVSSKAMNIPGLGEKIIVQLIKLNLVKSFKDLFSLTENKLINLKNIGKKLSCKLIQSLSSAKKTTLSRFLYSLSIPGVGETTSESLSVFYADINSLINTDIKSLQSVRDIGYKTANSIISFFRSEHNLNLIKELLNYKIQISNLLFIKYKKNNFFYNKNIVFTGYLNCFTRFKAKEKLLSYGAKIKNNISSKIDLLIVGKNTGKKLEIAKKIGIKIIKEEEFIILLKKIK